MSIEIIVIIAVVVILAGAYVFFSLAKRALRLAVRLTLFFTLSLIVAIAAGVLAWYASGDTKTSPQKNRPTNTRQRNSR